MRLEAIGHRLSARGPRLPTGLALESRVSHGPPSTVHPPLSTSLAPGLLFRKVSGSVGFRLVSSPASVGFRRVSSGPLREGVGFRRLSSGFVGWTVTFSK